LSAELGVGNTEEGGFMTLHMGKWIGAGALAYLTGCGIPTAKLIPLVVPVCQLTVTPLSLDFGTVGPGISVEKAVTVSNVSDTDCQISGVGMGAGSDSSFSLTDSPPAHFTIAGGNSASLSVTFVAMTDVGAGMRSADLVFSTNDPGHQTVDVPLSAIVETIPSCHLSISPPSLDLGTWTSGVTVSGQVTLTDQGSANCQVTELALAPGSDPSLSLADSQPTSFVVPAGGAVTFSVLFVAAAPAATHTGVLTFQTGDPSAPTAMVPLSATTICCQLTLTPTSLDFGAALLMDTAVVRSLTVSNSGNAACQISSLGFDSNSDPSFALPSSQPLAFTVDVGQSLAVSVNFDTTVAMPLTRTGTLSFQTGDPLDPEAHVPLTAAMCGDGCDTGNGCSDGTREGFIDEMTFPKIAGCQGGWSVGGMFASASCGLKSGNDSQNQNGAGCAAADLCSSNFHLCASQSEVAADLPTDKSCSDAIDVLNVFFASAQSGPGCTVCTVDNVCAFASDCSDCENLGACEDDVFGCGTMGSPPDSTCGILNMSSGDQCTALPFGGWSCTSPEGTGPNGSTYEGGCTEAAVITKSDGLSGGGVLCCKN
jgi:hypothetical protein